MTRTVMTPVPDPLALFDAVRAAAPVLRHPDTLRTVIVAALPAHEEELHRAAFKAKFLVKLGGVLQRVPTADASRDQLAATFKEEIEALRSLLRSIVREMPSSDGDSFESQFLAMDASAFAAFLEFLRDLQWVQNVALDRRS
jgi:hypothetical protein